tara:strand:- start:375 stop:719 length:345 start_codon:yes stop_codon:yes gene_type:complete
MNSYFLITITLMFGNIMGWYATNLQFFVEYWESRPFLSQILFGIPAGVAYWYATKMMMAINPELWSARFIAAIVSYTIFPLLTWYHLGESMFTLKTMLCIFFAFCILFVQIYIK